MREVPTTWLEKVVAQQLILDKLKQAEKEISRTGLIGRAAKVAIINMASQTFNPQSTIFKATTELFFEKYSQVEVNV